MVYLTKLINATRDPDKKSVTSEGFSKPVSPIKYTVVNPNTFAGLFNF